MSKYTKKVSFNPVIEGLESKNLLSSSFVLTSVATSSLVATVDPVPTSNPTPTDQTATPIVVAMADPVGQTGTDGAGLDTVSGYAAAAGGNLATVALGPISVLSGCGPQQQQNLNDAIKQGPTIDGDTNHPVNTQESNQFAPVGDKANPDYQEPTDQQKQLIFPYAPLVPSGGFVLTRPAIDPYTSDLAMDV